MASRRVTNLVDSECEEGEYEASAPVSEGRMSFLSLVVIVALIAGFYALRRVNQLQEQLRDLDNRLSLLDRNVAIKTDRATAASPAERIPAAHVHSLTVPPPAPSPHVPPAPPVVQPPATPPTVPSATPRQSSQPLPAAIPQRPVISTAADAAHPAGLSVTPPQREAAVDTGGARLETWEAIIGGSWLNRIGVTMLVLGITFALGYTLTQIGPLGKSLVASAVSLAMIAGGVVLERFEKYRFYGRGLIGGGWAALYATAYAVHELEATRIIEDPRSGFALLLLVGIGMIVHSLRYQNQGLTAIAYGLGYAAIVLHSISVFTLAAATLLGLGTMLHLLRRKWYWVAAGGMAATYGSLLLWYLRQESLTLETLRLGLAALAINWLVFIVPDFTAQPQGDLERASSRGISLFNGFAASVLAYLAWLRTYPDTSWLPLAVLGSVYVVTSPTLRAWDRRATHQIHSVAAAVLLAIAAGRGLSLTSATWFWLVEAQVVILIGIRLKDLFHRRLGSALFLIPMTAVLLEQVALRARQPDGALNLHRLLLNAAACGCFYWTHARLAGFDADDELERTIRRAFSYCAFGLIVLSLWVQLPMVWVAPALAGLMILLFELSARYRWRDLRTQSWLSGIAAALAAVFLSAPSETFVMTIHARVPALVVVAAAFATVFLRLAQPKVRVLDEDGTLRPALSWTGVALAALAVWLDARPTMVGPLWMILALVLVEAGLSLGEIHLRRPAYLLLLASHGSLVLSNLTATSEVMGLSVRTATLVPAIAATYYLWWRLREVRGKDEVGSDDWDEWTGRGVSYTAAALLGLYFRFQFGLDGAALRWAPAMVVLFLLGHWLRDADFRLQAYALGGAVFVRAVGFDFRHASPVLGIDGPLAVAVVSLVACLAAGFHLRARAAGAPHEDRRRVALESRLAQHGVDLMWLMGVVLVAIYLFRTQAGSMLIVSWALWGLMVSAGGFAWRTPSLRFAGLGLLGLALVLTLVRAFTTFDTMGRIISFTILGLVLLLVSLGYTRYRHWFRKTG